MQSDRVIVYTLDLECDYAGIAPHEAYEALHRQGEIKHFIGIIRRYNIKLTVFATGKALESNWENLSFLREIGAEIELHGYDHHIFNADVKLEIENGNPDLP